MNDKITRFIGKNFVWIEVASICLLSCFIRITPEVQWINLIVVAIICLVVIQYRKHKNANK